MKPETRRWIANFAAGLVAMVAIVLRHYAPESSSFYPQCPVFFWLHVYCPGCGATRALAALLHGRLGEALRWNAMLVLFLPFATTFSAVTYWRAVRPGRFVWPEVPDSFLKVFVLVIAVFTVLRNVQVF